MRRLHRLRFDADVVVAVKLAFVGEGAGRAPRLEDDIERLVVACGRFVHWDAEAVDLRPREAAPDTKVEASARQQVDRRRLFGQTYRVVERQHEDGRAETHRRS